MVLELIDQLIPWAILAAILFFVWLININNKRLRKIRYSGRISEIIDRRRNVIAFTIIIVILFIGLLFDLFVK